MMTKLGSALPYSIRINRADALIEAALRGVITISDVAGYRRALNWQLFVHNLPHYAMMIDITACLFQSDAVARLMVEYLAFVPHPHAVAVVTRSQLTQSQFTRLFTQPHARIVTTIADGRAWVLHGIEPPPS